MAEADKDRTPTKLRTLEVLDQVAKLGVPVTPAAVNKYLGFPKPTIHRLFATLEAQGYVQRELDGKSYSPGPRLRALSLSVLSSERIRTARLAILSKLAEDIGETCNIAWAEHWNMIYVERVETKWPLRIQFATGAKIPLYCTAAGKLYLSSLTKAQVDTYFKTVMREPAGKNALSGEAALRDNLAEIRAQGFASDDEEFIDGMVALAVPIHDESGRVASTLSFHAPTARMNLAQALDHLPLLTAAALELEGHLSR